MTRPTRFLDLPYEMRSQIFQQTFHDASPISACSCAERKQSRPFIGECTSPDDLRRYVLDLPKPLSANSQTYNETLRLAEKRKVDDVRLILGGTKCFQTFLRHLPAQHPSTISLILRLYVTPEWLQTTWGPDSGLRSVNSLLGSLGIGTGQAYTCKTTSTRVLPKEDGTDLQIMEVYVDLMMQETIPKHGTSHL